ncbi:hypothetical protein SCB17_002007 [Clostridium perfringens]|nr:hypothetical protein [Clostridium perfringens]MDU3845618.1 hypothetical protein [Clostridium perfringens]
MDILENGLDSFSKSINLFNDLINNRNSNQYEFLLKDCIINLHHSTETLFKYLIKIKNEYLIYDDLDKVFKGIVDNSFKPNSKKEKRGTIKFIDAIRRVIVLYNLNIKEEEFKRFDFLNTIRNNITHYEFEFEENIAEHTMALLIPTLFSIYSSKIETFSSFASEKNLYNSMQTQINNITIWNLNRYFILDNKIAAAKERIRILEENPQEKGRVMQLKENGVNYVECPMCKEKKFLANGNFILNCDDIDFIGICRYCNIDIENQDLQFINLNFNSFNDFNENSVKKRRFIIDNIKEVVKSDISLQSKYTEDEYNDIEQIFTSNIEKISEFINHIIQYRIDDLDSVLAKIHFEENIYENNDVTEQLLESSDSIYLGQEELLRAYSNRDMVKDILKDLNNIISNSIELLEEEIVIDMVERHEESYSYHQGIYLNSDGQDVDGEIEIRVNLDSEAFFSAINNV